MLYSIIVGAISGWLAGKLFKGGGFGFILNVVIGIVGGVIGGWTFGLIGIQATGFIGKIVTSVVGAGLFFWLISLFNRKR